MNRLVYGNVTEGFDPKAYALSPRDYSLWPNAIYDVVGATLHRPGRRALVSIGLSLAEYLVGLAIAMANGFGQLYVTTPAVYILAIACGLFMGRARRLTVDIPHLIADIRLVFAVSDEVYMASIRRASRCATNRRVSLPLAAVVCMLAWAAIGTYYFAPTTAAGKYLKYLAASAYPSVWSQGSHLIAKMIIVDFYVGVALFFTIPILYASIAGLLCAAWTFGRWPVMPIPAYVATGLQPAADYLFRAATYYALAIFTVILLYPMRRDIIFVGSIATFSVVGLAVLLGPYLLIGRLIAKARQQLGVDVALTYYTRLWPVAGSDVSGVVPVPKTTPQEYGQLIKLQKLMHSANQSEGLVYQANYVLFGSIIQLAPTVLTLLVALFPTLVSIVIGAFSPLPSR